jgi:hypothetical protein
MAAWRMTGIYGVEGEECEESENEVKDDSTYKVNGRGIEQGCQTHHNLILRLGG